MAQKSPIEWTELAFEQKFKALFEFVGNEQVFDFNPLKHIFIFLRRIARGTSRKYILDFGITAFGNWYNMVKSCGRSVTISTFSVKLFQNLYLGFGLYWFAIAFSTVCVLLSFTAIIFVSCVSDSGFFGFMRFAQSVFRNKFRFQPLLTNTTPTQTFFRHQSAFANADSVCFRFIGTIAALTFQSVKTRAIFRKKLDGLPFLTNSAFFQSNLNLFQVFSNRKPGFFCRAFNRAIFSLSHNTFLNLSNFSIRGKISNVV